MAPRYTGMKPETPRRTAGTDEGVSSRSGWSSGSILHPGSLNPFHQDMQENPGIREASTRISRIRSARRKVVMFVRRRQLTEEKVETG